MIATFSCHSYTLRSFAIALLCLAVLMPCAHAQPVNYGDEVSGVELALEQPAPGKLRLHLRNKGPGDARLSEGFAWVLLAESREKAVYTARQPLDEERPVLAPAQTMTREIDLATTPLFPFRKGTMVVQGYPQAPADPQAIEELPATLKAQAFAYVTIGGERITAKSRAMPVILRAREGAASQPAEVVRLIEQFRRDAFSAQAAHDRAVKIGASTLPALMDAMADKTMPDFGQMWIATAIVHINGEVAGEFVAGLVGHSTEGVRNVVAYHGPTMRRTQVDKAIIKRAERGDDALFTAWAARGFAENGRAFPAELVEAAFKSKEPRARAEIADVLARSADAPDIVRLTSLCGDDNELVRVAAADAVRKYKLRNARLAVAMVQSLDMPGEASRERMVQALASMAEKPWKYDAQMTQEQRVTTIEQIREWSATKGRD